MTEPEQSADCVADHERPFPPPTITKWVNYGWVSSEMLLAEMRYWTDFLELGMEQERHHA